MFDSVKVDLRDIVLLEPEGRQNLLGFIETGVGDINYAAYLEEVATHTHTLTHTHTQTHRQTHTHKHTLYVCYRLILSFPFQKLHKWSRN